MTVGSLRTMPRPLAYTRVFAVPRSMARSLARPALPALGAALRPPVGTPVPVGVGREGLELPGESLHVRFHRPGLAVAEPEQKRTEQAQDDGDAEVHEVGHETVSPTSPSSLTGWAQLDQSRPPDHVSRFQMGTVAFRVSMQNRAASKASDRWGAEATTTTDVSPTSRGPVRWSRARRPTTGQRRRASVAIAPRRGTTSSS